MIENHANTELWIWMAGVRRTYAARLGSYDTSIGQTIAWLVSYQLLDIAISYLPLWVWSSLSCDRSTMLCALFHRSTLARRNFGFLVVDSPSTNAHISPIYPQLILNNYFKITYDFFVIFPRGRVKSSSNLGGRRHAANGTGPIVGTINCSWRPLKNKSAQWPLWRN